MGFINQHSHYWGTTRSQELCLQRFPPIATTSVEPPATRATRQRCEALTTEAAMESAFLDEARMEMKEMQLGQSGFPEGISMVF
jgi:hypothetical protein